MAEEIKNNLVFLTENLTNLPSILNHCVQNEIITRDDKERIMAGETPQDRNDRFIDNVMKRDWKEIKIDIIKILRKTSNEHCADKIEASTVDSRNELPKSEGRKTKRILDSKWWPEEKKLPPSFIERKEDRKFTDVLKDYLTKSKNKSSVISQGTTITGMGGVGKTTIAKWFAIENHDNYDHIIWIDCGEKNLSTCFTELAKELKVDTKLRLNSVSKACFSKLEGVKCLFIFDNAECYQGRQGIRDVLPNHDNFHTIITSRTKEWGTESGDGQIPEMHLAAFPTRVSIDFLTMNLKNTQHREEQLEQLSDLLGNLPLALQIALNALNTKHTSINQYIDRIKNSDHIINQKFDDYEKTINNTMKMSLDIIEEHESDPEQTAHKILLILGYIKADLVEIKLFEAIEKITEFEAKEAIELLEKYSLVTIYSNQDGNIDHCSINKLLQNVIRHNSKEKENLVLEKILGVEGFLDYKIIPYLYADEKTQSLFPEVRAQLVEQGKIKEPQRKRRSSKAVKTSPTIVHNMNTPVSKGERTGLLANEDNEVLSNETGVKNSRGDQLFDNQNISTSEDTSGPEMVKSLIIKTKVEPERVIRIGENGSIYYYDDQELGRGASSTVFKGYFEVEERETAVKKLDMKHFNKKELDILREVDRHVNVVRYFASEEFKSHYYFAMELGMFTLELCVNKKAEGYVDTSLQTIQNYLLDACKGLEWLHYKNIIHRDIKPTNIVIFQAEETFVAKLVDFGLSRKLASMTEGTNSHGKGTADWMSPEGLIALDGRVYKTTPGIDVFSLGATMFYSLSEGTHPFGSQIWARYPNIINNPPNWQYINEQEIALKNLLSQMMAKKPEHRPTMGCVLEHPYFWDGKTQLEFINTVSNSLAAAKLNLQSCLTNAEIEDIRDKIDNHMNMYFSIGNWQDKLCPKVTDLLKQYNSKKYKADSAMKLVEFIRDKYQHRREWDESLKCDSVFGKTDEKYMMYFSARFPALIPVLYTILQEYLEKLENLKSKFFQINVTAVFPLAIQFNKINNS